jgi:hypothetical protein
LVTRFYEEGYEGGMTGTAFSWKAERKEGKVMQQEALVTQNEPRTQAAAGGWFACNVTMTGPAETGEIYIRLREVGGQFEKWFSAVGQERKEMLATALTAISTGYRVTAALSTTDEYGTINRLYVTR